MATPGPWGERRSVPDLDFRVEDAEPLEYAAVPTLSFRLRVRNLDPEPIRSVLLNAQVRIAAAQRHYLEGEQERLLEVFGAASRWDRTLTSLLWTNATVLVQAFEAETTAELAVPCTYDFEVASAKYFAALEGGEVPLEFLFSGTVFYAGRVGLQVARISWEKEAQYRLPVAVWKRAVEHFFPNSAWLRLRRDTFDRLYAYKARNLLPSWDAALDGLLGAVEEAR